MVAALTKSSEIIAQNSAVLEQIYQRLGADGGREIRPESAHNGR